MDAPFLHVLCFGQMISGYVDGQVLVYCQRCWSRLSDPRAFPHLILTTDNDGDAWDESWIVDRCETCGADVSYRSCRLVGPVGELLRGQASSRPDGASRR